MIYRFDTFLLNTNEFTIYNDADKLSLEPRVFDVLVYLIVNKDRVVSKDELIETLWDGRVITDSALNTCIRSVRRALGDNREHQRFIRTFPKRGFQFVGNIETNEPKETQAGLEDKPVEKRTEFKKKATIFGSFLILILMVLLASRWAETDTHPDLSAKATIAVLNLESAFQNDKQKLFTDGLVEELVSSLSLYRELFVIARNSSALYDDVTTGTKEIGRALGADYIVDGGVRYEGDQIRISVWLIDSRSGQQVWSTKIDRSQSEIYVLQNELAYMIAGQIVPEVVRADAEKNNKKAPDVLDAWALYHKARTKQSIYSKEMQDEAIHWADQALIRDPNLAAAHGIIARAKGTQFFHQWTDDPEKTLAEAITSARMSISLDSNDPGAYAALGYIYRYTGDETSALANLERATFLNPSDANIKLEYAHTLDWFRHQKQALPEINQALKLSPRDPRLENMLFYKAHIQFHLLDFGGSLATTKEMSGVLTTNTWRVFYYLIRAANLAQLGRQSEAEENIQAALTVNPRLNLSAMRKKFEGSKNHPENRRFWLTSLELAGLPKN